MTENLIIAKAAAIAANEDWATMTHRDRLYAIQDALEIARAKRNRR